MATPSRTSHAHSKLRSSLSFERRPKLLKDFLVDDEAHSCTSNGFRAKPSKSVIQKIPDIILKRSKSDKTSSLPSQLVRSRSRAASSTIFAIHKASEMVSNAIKFLPFASIKSPSILPRSISRKLSGRRKEKYDDCVEGEVSVTVKVKDILRWRSFRDLVEDRSTPLDLHSSPARCTSTATTTDSTSTRTSSQRSSWCDSDFTAEDFPSWCYESSECFNDYGTKFAKQYLLDQGVGEDFMKTTRTMNKDPTRDMPSDDEYEQHTPVSVLDSPFQEDEESISIFHRTLANIDRRKCVLMQRIEGFENLADLSTVKSPSFDEQLYCSFTEEIEFQEIVNGLSNTQAGDKDVNKAKGKAKRLLGLVQDKILANNSSFNLEHQILFDFFKHEMCTSGKEKNDVKYERELVRLAENWLSGVYEESFEWGVEGKKESYVREMERGLSWNKFEEEQEEMALQLESLMINSLVDELLIDLLTP